MRYFSCEETLTATDETVTASTTGTVEYKRKGVLERQLSLTIAGLKESSIELVGLKVQALEHGK